MTANLYLQMGLHILVSYMFYIQNRTWLQVEPGGCQQGRGPLGLEAGPGLPKDMAKAVRATATELWLPYRASWYRPRWPKQMPSASTGACLPLLLHLIRPVE